MMNLNIERYIKKTVIFLLLFLPVIFNPFGFDCFAMPRVWFLYFCSFLLLCLLFLYFFKNKEIKIRYTFLHGIVFVFAFFVCLSLFFAQDIYIAFWGFWWDYEGVLSWFCYFLLFTIGFLFFRNKNDLQKLIFALSVPMIVVGVYSVFQYFFDIQLMDWFQETEIRRASSFLGHPSYLGIYCVLLLPLFFYAMTEEDISLRRKKIISTAFVFGIVSLILSFSRGAWVSFIIITILYVFLNRQKIRKLNVWNKKYLAGGVVLLVLFLLILFLNSGFLFTIKDRFFSIFDPQTATTQVRFLLYRQSWALLGDHWLFGVGADNFAYVVSAYFLNHWNVFDAMIADKAHNQFIDYWVSFGIGGLISYIAILASWFVLFWRAIKKEDANTPLIKAIALSIIAYLAAVQFHYSTIDLAPIFWFLFGAGLAFFVHAGVVAERSKLLFVGRHKSLSFIKKEVFVICLFLALLFSYFAYHKLSADYYFARAFEDKKSLDESIVLLEKSIKNNTHMPNYYLALNDYYIKKGDMSYDYAYYQKAVDLMIDASQKIDSDYRMVYELGETYLKVVNYAENIDYLYEQAQKAYRKSLELYPNHIDSNLKMGVVSAYLGEDEIALDYWNKCINLQESNEQCYYNLYILHSKRGENEKAQEYYKKYLDLTIE